jgi:uncharacterized membrane protein HdeD (DUF308 family)
MAPLCTLFSEVALRHTAWSILLMGVAFLVVGIYMTARDAPVGGVAVALLGAGLLLVGAVRARSLRRKGQSFLRGRG